MIRAKKNNKKKFDFDKNIACDFDCLSVINGMVK